MTVVPGQAAIVNCPICEDALEAPDRAGGGLPVAAADARPFDCPNCGRFRLTGTLLAMGSEAWPAPRDRALVSHSIRRRQRPGEWPLITPDEVVRIRREQELPTPREQVDRLLQVVAERSQAPGEFADVSALTDRALLGALSPGGVDFALQTAQHEGLLRWDASGGGQHAASLEVRGWDRLDELRRTRVESRKAFMAMKYGDEELEALYAGTLKAAVLRAGFTLFRLDESPSAGLIDHRLRVELRRSRFLIADLTHANPGAYWEAGFMEGLGRPVIYLCKAAVFAERKTHFDTNHSQHVLWDSERPERCGEMLAATIRATLPEEAQLEDAPPR